MKKILIVIFIIVLLGIALIGFQYFRKASRQEPYMPGKIIQSETFIPDGNSGE